MAKIPKWVNELVVAVYEETNYPLPQITWRRYRAKKYPPENFDGEMITPHKPKPFYSTGRAYPTRNRIVVTTGKSRKDQKLVLLHELAHLLAPKKEHHGEKFWQIAWKLYRKYKVPINYAKKREYSYIKMSRKVFLNTKATPSQT